MSKLVQFEVKEFPAVRVVGRAIRPVLADTQNPVPAFWSQCFAENLFQPLEAMPEQVVCGDYVGFMYGWTPAEGKFTYIVGMLMKPDTVIPEGYNFTDVPAGSAAVGWIQGKETENYPVAHEMTAERLVQEGWRADDGADWCMELYNCPRFTTPDANGEVILDYYIPCVKAE